MKLSFLGRRGFMALAFILAYSFSSFAMAIAMHSGTLSSADLESFKFQFKYASESLVLETKAKNFEEALPRLAQVCFDHFKKNVKLTESTGLDIIDVCANPRRI